MGTLSYPCSANFSPDLTLVKLDARFKATKDAERYVEKFLVFIRFHLAQRDAGKRKIVTAHEKYKQGLYKGT